MIKRKTKSELLFHPHKKASEPPGHHQETYNTTSGIGYGTVSHTMGRDPVPGHENKMVGHKNIFV